jgi:hypothetical protein
VVLEGLDGLFGCIYAMVVGFYQLDLDIIIFKAFLDGFAGYIVDNIEAWLKSSFG